MSAVAGSAAGNWNYWGPNSGFNYQNRAVIYTDNPSAYLTTKTQAGASVPPGYMGDYAALYFSGTLCNDTIWHYNSHSDNEFIWATGQYFCGPGPYQADGKSQTWKENDSAYATHGADRSPAQNQS